MNNFKSCKHKEHRINYKYERLLRSCPRTYLDEEHNIIRCIAKVVCNHTGIMLNELPCNVYYGRDISKLSGTDMIRELDHQTSLCEDSIIDIEKNIHLINHTEYRKKVEELVLSKKDAIKDYYNETKTIDSNIQYVMYTRGLVLKNMPTFIRSDTVLREDVILRCYSHHASAYYTNKSIGSIREQKRIRQALSIYKKEGINQIHWHPGPDWKSKTKRNRHNIRSVMADNLIFEIVKVLFYNRWYIGDDNLKILEDMEKVHG